jgi:hypothetical protein
MLPLVDAQAGDGLRLSGSLKVPIDQIDKAPQHFTNLHMGLQLARRILRKRTSENKQIFIITDGQPTAHVEGDFVYLLYPPDPRSTVATLKEAVLAVREGCRISTFALIEDYWGMDWVGFVDQLTKLTKGVAFYTSSGELASCIMESYLSGRKKEGVRRLSRWWSPNFAASSTSKTAPRSGMPSGNIFSRSTFPRRIT